MVQDSHIASTRLWFSPTTKIDSYTTDSGNTVITLSKYVFTEDGETYSSSMYEFVMNDRNRDFMQKFANEILNAVIVNDAEEEVTKQE